MTSDSERWVAWVRRWLEEAVVGLQLCPFAANVVRSNRVEIVVSDAHEEDDALRAVLSEADALLDTPDRATTLVLFPHALADFETFLDAVADFEALLEESGADAWLQTASFHPEYQFEGEDPDGVSHYTNRTACPIIQLLRVEDVAEATDNHPDPEGIPAANVERLEEMGASVVRALWSRFGVAAPSGNLE